jgi:hypothetical protein
MEMNLNGWDPMKKAGLPNLGTVETGLNQPILVLSSKKNLPPNRDIPATCYAADKVNNAITNTGLLKRHLFDPVNTRILLPVRNTAQTMFESQPLQAAEPVSNPTTPEWNKPKSPKHHGLELFVFGLAAYLLSQGRNPFKRLTHPIFKLFPRSLSKPLDQR